MRTNRSKNHTKSVHRLFLFFSCVTFVTCNFIALSSYPCIVTQSGHNDFQADFMICSLIASSLVYVNKGGWRNSLCCRFCFSTSTLHQTLLSARIKPLGTSNQITITHQTLHIKQPRNHFPPWCPEGTSSSRAALRISSATSSPTCLCYFIVEIGVSVRDEKRAGWMTRETHPLCLQATRTYK